jgi:hypothetical protein
LKHAPLVIAVNYYCVTYSSSPILNQFCDNLMIASSSPSLNFVSSRQYQSLTHLERRINGMLFISLKRKTSDLLEIGIGL